MVGKSGKRWETGRKRWEEGRKGMEKRENLKKGKEKVF